MHENVSHTFADLVKNVKLRVIGCNCKQIF